MNITAEARRSGDWWAIQVPEVDGAYSQARRLDQVEDMARDAAAALLNVEPDTIDVTVKVVEHPALGTVERALAVRRQADALADETQTQMRAAARELVAHGITVRDAGALLAVSPQRISQLVNS